MPSKTFGRLLSLEKDLKGYSRSEGPGIWPKYSAGYGVDCYPAGNGIRPDLTRIRVDKKMMIFGIAMKQVRVDVGSFWKRGENAGSGDDLNIETRN